jgi:hypothetical protein
MGGDRYSGLLIRPEAKDGTPSTKMKEELLQPTREPQGPNSMTRKPLRCDAQACGRPAMCTLDLHFFCVDHFIKHCYVRLNRLAPIPFAGKNDVAADIEDRFLQQCSDQAANLLRPFRGLDNLDRARLFDILLWSSELLAKRQIFKTVKTGEIAPTGPSVGLAKPAVD